MGALPERIALESRITVLLLKDVNAALRCREMSRPAAMLVSPLNRTALPRARCPRHLSVDSRLLNCGFDCRRAQPALTPPDNRLANHLAGHRPRGKAALN
jgi:hypothetical protein